jgi:hypothetical protein
MLNKLIKYEFRSSSRLIPLVYLASVLLAAMGAFVALSNNPVLLMIAYILLMLAGSAALTITYVVIIVRFYKGMYGAEGYLAHTLPTDAKILYRSKTIVSFVWIAGSMIVTSALWCVAGMLFFRAINATVSEPFSAELTTDFAETFAGIFSAPMIIWLIVTTVIGWLAFLAIVFFCITISTVKPFSRLGIGSSVLAYVAVSIINQIVTVILMTALPLSVKYSVGTGWAFSTQTMWSWFLETITMSSNSPDPGLVISLGISLPSIFFAFVLPVFTKRMLERKMILK